MQAPQMSMSRRKVILVAGQEAKRMGGYTKIRQKSWKSSLTMRNFRLTNFRHIQEIDTALNNGPHISALTNLFDDDDDCRSTDLADKALIELNSGGHVVEEMLDQGPSTMVCCSRPSGHIVNNLNSRTWKRIITGLKITNPNSVETHARSKRGAENHAKNDMRTTLKKKKVQTEVAEVSKLMAMEFTETAVAARQRRQDR